jgi:HEAT repeat protein
MEIAGIVLVLLIASISAYGMQKINDRNVDTWRSVARELGLSFAGGARERTIDGQLGGVSVRARYDQFLGNQRPGSERELAEHRHVQQQVTFYGAEDGCIPDSLSVRRDDATRLLGRRFGERDVPIGDASFDELAELPGLDAAACAALSHDAREQLTRFLKLGGEVRKGVLWCAIDGGAEHERDSLLAMLQFLSQLSKALTVTRESLHQRLSDNALRDPHPAVRWRNLRFLAQPQTRTPADLLLSTARALLADPSGAVRTLAARQLGAEGLAVLRAEASNAQAHHELRSAALQALADLGAPDLEPMLGGLLAGSAPPELACTALALVAQQQLSGLSSVVASWTEHESEAVRAAAAAALAKLTGSEPALLRLLSDASPTVQQAAVEALADAGSVRAVEPLLPLAQALVPGALRSAARASIARIQARLGGVQAGQVSLADQQQLLVGAVDLADVSVAVRVGELSLSEDTDTSVSDGAQLRDTRSSQRKMH